MDETVNEQPIFEESDFLDEENDQTEENGGAAVEEAGDNPTSQEPTNGTDPADSPEGEPQTDDGGIEDFLAKKGIDSNDPEALHKVAKMYQNVEREFGKKSQEKAHLERIMQQQQQTASSDVPGVQALQELRSYKTQQEAREWEQKNQPTPEIQQKMGEYLTSPILDGNGNPVMGSNGQPLQKGQLVINGALTLDDVYRIVGGNTIKANTIKAELKDEVRREAAVRQTAKRPAATATNAQQYGDKANDPFLQELLAGY